MFTREVDIEENTGLFIDKDLCLSDLTQSNIDGFSDKWSKFYSSVDRGRYDGFQKEWFKTLYGMSREKLLRSANHGVVLDAGCGSGDKTQAMAIAVPENTFWGADLSSHLQVKAEETKPLDNLSYIRGDISNLPFEDSSFDLIICDQVLHHTISPADTLREFKRLLRPGGILATYVYRKKALPRELLDQYFIDNRSHSHDDLMVMSEQLMHLGKILTEFSDQLIDFPAIDLLEIPAQRKSVQRYIYDNFIKCTYNPAVGDELSTLVNFDWYVADIAYRYTREEFLSLAGDTGFENVYLHEENACLSGRFLAT